MDFTITAHIEFKSKTGAVNTSVIRMVVPAENGAEAREKAEQFIQRKTTVVIDTCEYKPPVQTIFETEGEFGEIFKNWPFKSQGREE